MDRAQAYGLTKDAADDLYKEAGIMSAFSGAGRAMCRLTRAAGKPIGARDFRAATGRLLGQRAFARRYNTDSCLARLQELHSAHTARANALANPLSLYDSHLAGWGGASPDAMRGAFRAIGGDSAFSSTSFRNLYPAQWLRGKIFGSVSRNLGKAPRGGLW